MLELLFILSTITHTQLKPIMEKHCIQCHNSNWVDKNWMDYNIANKHCDKFINRVVLLKDMPPGNITEMNDKEREMFKNWVDGGCKK